MNDEERDALDDELRRLFADERLTLPVARGAEAAVVKGAYRRRRQRLTVAAAGGVLAVAAMVTAGVGLAGIGHGPTRIATAASQPPSVTLTTTSPSPTSTQDLAYPIQFGPNGVGQVRLGMSMAQVIRIAKPPKPPTSTAGGCQVISLEFDASVRADGSAILIFPTTTVTTAGAPASAPGQSPGPYGKPQDPSRQSVTPVIPAKMVPVLVDVTVSPRFGVVQLDAASLLRTPEGIGIGSHLAEISKVYGKTGAVNVKSPAVTVAVPGNPSAEYVFVTENTGVVQTMWLRDGSVGKC